MNGSAINKTKVFLFQLITRYLVRGSWQSFSFIMVGWASLKRESVTFSSYIREKFLLSWVISVNSK